MAKKDFPSLDTSESFYFRRRVAKNQPSKPNRIKSADQGKLAAVHRVKMEVGIAMQAISGREHKTSLARARVRMDVLSIYFPTIWLQGCSFLRGCVTPFECLKRLLWLPVHPAVLDC